jgi:hypothetical protein
MLNALEDPKTVAQEAKTRDEDASLIDVACEEGHDEVVDYLESIVGDGKSGRFYCIII